MNPSVPRLFPGATVACIATGPSLTQADVDACRDRARVIVINDAWKLAPWADVLWACDAKWWKWPKNKEAKHFAGLKYALTRNVPKGVEILRNTGMDGLEKDPSGVRAGHNSGYQAINCAVHLGASRIVLLGYDMQGNHYFGAHPDGSKPPFAACLQSFKTLVAPLAALNIDIVNCSRKTAITSFRRAELSEVLDRVEAVA